METLNRVYYRIDGYDNLPTIHLSDLNVFEELLEKYNPEFIFVSEKTDQQESEEKDLLGRAKSVAKKNSYFSFYNNGLVYKVNSLNYKSLDDYKVGGEKGYKSGDDFYQAQNGSFVDREEFENCKAAGFDDRVDYLKAKAIGFEGACNKLEQAFIDGRISDTEYKKIKDYKTDAQVFGFAKELGYEGYDEFESALASGFAKVNADEYRAAVEKGFDSSESYQNAKEGNFDDVEQFQAASTLGIDDKGEFDKYNELSKLQDQYGFRSLEQANLFAMLSDLPAGKKISVARMWDMVEEAKSGMKGASVSGNKKWYDTPILDFFNKDKGPDWYSTSFKDIVEMKVFLISNENINKIGLYDADGEVFERSGGAEGAAPAASAEETK